VASEGRAVDAARRPPRNRAVWIVGAALVVLFAVAAVVIGKSGSASKINQGTRAVIVSTDDAARTVLVPPCGTGVAVASPNPAAIASTSGTTAVAFPRGQGVRIVLVPKCAGGRGATAGSSGLPSAVFVPRAGTPVPPVKPGSEGSGPPQVADPGSAQTHLTVAAGSPVRTIVVSPCEKTKVAGPAERVLAPSGSSATAVAPAC
jgi:hypothetical protein